MKFRLGSNLKSILSLKLVDVKLVNMDMDLTKEILNMGFNEVFSFAVHCKGIFIYFGLLLYVDIFFTVVIGNVTLISDICHWII